MLSDCVISGLYMRVLKLTWKNLMSVNFPQFSDVSVWSVRMVSIGVRKDKWSGRYSLGVWSRMEPNHPDGTCLRPDACPVVSKTVWTRATCLLVPNAARVQMTLMHRSDGDPTEAIYTPESPLSPPYPTKSPLWHFVSDCF
jgi:hypothetical protein